MNLNFYTIYDSAPITYNRPFLCQSDAEALRMFDDLCIDAEHPIGQHPEHYFLYRVGQFDQETGRITSETIKPLATAVERLAAQQKIKPNSLQDERALQPGGTI